MGLFHTTIREIMAKIDEGNLADAAKKAKQHIAAEHHFESQLVRLQRIVGAYHEDLLHLSRMGKLGENYKKNALKIAEDAETQLDYIKSCIKGLIRTKKIELD
jgi:hypothetical protein